MECYEATGLLTDNPKNDTYVKIMDRMIAYQTMGISTDDYIPILKETYKIEDMIKAVQIIKELQQCGLKLKEDG